MDNILSSEFLKRALDESDHGILVTDYEGTILSVNEGLVKLTGFDEKELVGSNPRLLKSGQTPEAVYRELWGTLRSGRTWKGAVLNRAKDGSHFLDRETILSGIEPRSDRACFVAIHRNADIELDLRVKLSRAEASIGHFVDETDKAKAAIQTLVTLTNRQAETTSHALIAAIEARDAYTAGHGRRTALMMELIGDELGMFDRCSREAARIGAILHDIGKVGIPDAILLKQGRLTTEEYAVIKAHPSIGFDILKLAFKHEEILRIVRHHHERLDGTGYPDGLRGHELPDYVKVLSVCDCFDAMTSTRSYRRAMTEEDALSILTDDALTGRLDMAAVRALKRLSRNGVLGDVIAMPAVA